MSSGSDSDSSSSSQNSDGRRGRSPSQTSPRRRSWSPSSPRHSDRSRSLAEETRDASRSPNTSPARYRHLWALGLDPQRDWPEEPPSTSGTSHFEREQLSDETQIKIIELKSWIEAGTWRAFENTHPEDLPAELQTAELLGINPMHVGDPGFDDIANEGPIKWVVTQGGELLVAHSIVAHTVLIHGEPVLAAGEAKIELGENGYVCREINNRSDQYQPDDRSLEIGK